MRPTASTSAGSTRGDGLAAAGFGQAKRLAQERRGGQASGLGLGAQLGLLGRRAPKDEGLRQRLLCAGFYPRRWGSKGRLAAPRKVPCHPRQRMTWVALLFAQTAWRYCRGAPFSDASRINSLSKWS